MHKVRTPWGALALLLLACALAACEGLWPVGPAPAADRLAGTAWRLQAFRELDMLWPPLPDTRLTLAFGVDGTFGGSAGCNSFFGRYALDGARLTVRELAATEMYCAEPAGVMDQEADFLAALRAGGRYRLEPGLLTLDGGAGESVLFELDRAGL